MYNQFLHLHVLEAFGWDIKIRQNKEEGFS